MAVLYTHIISVMGRVPLIHYPLINKVKIFVSGSVSLLTLKFVSEPFMLLLNLVSLTLNLLTFFSQVK